MTEQLIQAKAKNIESMDFDELQKLDIDINLSELDAKSKAILLNLIDDRYLELNKQANAAVVTSEIKLGDLS